MPNHDGVLDSTWAERMQVGLRGSSFPFRRLVEGAQRAVEGFGRALAPMFDGFARAAHLKAYKGDRKHFRRCPTCNPSGNSKPRTGGAEYHRRQKNRRRKARR